MREEGGGRGDHSISSVSSLSPNWRWMSLSLSSYASYTSLVPAHRQRQPQSSAGRGSMEPSPSKHMQVQCRGRERWAWLDTSVFCLSQLLMRPTLHPVLNPPPSQRLPAALHSDPPPWGYGLRRLWPQEAGSDAQSPPGFLMDPPSIPGQMKSRSIAIAPRPTHHSKRPPAVPPLSVEHRRPTGGIDSRRSPSNLEMYRLPM